MKTTRVKCANCGKEITKETGGIFDIYTSQIFCLHCGDILCKSDQCLNCENLKSCEGRLCVDCPCKVDYPYAGCSRGGAAKCKNFKPKETLVKQD